MYGGGGRGGGGGVPSLGHGGHLGAMAAILAATKCEYIKMVGAPPSRPPGYRFGSSAPSFGGFGTGSSNMVKPLDPKRFHIYRENRDEPL